jgi:hypothetical protein
MENKTALQLFLDELEKVNDSEGVANLIDKALELEKLQIIEAYQWGRTDQNSKEKKWYNRNARIYYSETYKKPTE